MKMKEIFPNPSNGIFNYINIENAGLDNKVYLNIAYHTNNGNKLISPLLENFVTNNSITSDNLTIVGNTISEIYKEKWKALYKTTIMSYNPIENYNMTENETVNSDIANNESSTSKSTNNSTSTNTTNASQTDNRTSTNKSNVSQTDNNTVENTASTDLQTYGFNSSSAVDKDKNLSTENIKNNTTSTNETSSSITDNNTLNNESTSSITGNNTLNNENTTTSSASNDTTRELKRSGNIGVTTTQQMLQQERELWDWNYYNTVFKDIDNLLTLMIYE